MMPGQYLRNDLLNEDTAFYESAGLESIARRVYLASQKKTSFSHEPVPGAAPRSGMLLVCVSGFSPQFLYEAREAALRTPNRESRSSSPSRWRSLGRQ